MCFLNRVEIPRHGYYNVRHIYFNPEVVTSARLLGFSLNSHEATRWELLYYHLETRLKQILSPKSEAYLVRSPRGCIAQSSDGHLPQNSIGIPGTLIHENQYVSEISMLPEDLLLHKLKSTDSSPLESLPSRGQLKAP